VNNKAEKLSAYLDTIIPTSEVLFTDDLLTATAVAAKGAPRAPSTGWSAYEVWRTRVKATTRTRAR